MYFDLYRASLENPLEPRRRSHRNFGKVNLPLGQNLRTPMLLAGLQKLCLIHHSQNSHQRTRLTRCIDTRGNRRLLREGSAPTLSGGSRLISVPADGCSSSWESSVPGIHEQSMSMILATTGRFDTLKLRKTNQTRPPSPFAMRYWTRLPIASASCNSWRRQRPLRNHSDFPSYPCCVR